jgi:hypothetical protein
MTTDGRTGNMKEADLKVLVTLTLQPTVLYQ